MDWTFNGPVGNVTNTVNGNIVNGDIVSGDKITNNNNIYENKRNSFELELKSAVEKYGVSRDELQLIIQILQDMYSTRCDILIELAKLSADTKYSLRSLVRNSEKKMSFQDKLSITSNMAALIQFLVDYLQRSPEYLSKIPELLESATKLLK